MIPESISIEDVNEVFVKLLLRTNNKCVWCSKKFDQPLAIRGKVRSQLNTDWLVHSQQSHGFEPEDILHMIEVIKSNEELIVPI